jgi:hypothetical protein
MTWWRLPMTGSCHGLVGSLVPLLLATDLVPLAKYDREHESQEEAETERRDLFHVVHCHGNCWRWSYCLQVYMTGIVTHGLPHVKIGINFAVATCYFTLLPLELLPRFLFDFFNTILTTCFVQTILKILKNSNIYLKYIIFDFSYFN